MGLGVWTVNGLQARALAAGEQNGLHINLRS